MFHSRVVFFTIFWSLGNISIFINLVLIPVWKISSLYCVVNIVCDDIIVNKLLSPFTLLIFVLCVEYMNIIGVEPKPTKS